MDYKSHKACDKYEWDTGVHVRTLLFEKNSSRLVAEMYLLKNSDATTDYDSIEEFTQWDETSPDAKVFEIAALEEQCGCKCEPL